MLNWQKQSLKKLSNLNLIKHKNLLIKPARS